MWMKNIHRDQWFWWDVIRYAFHWNEDPMLWMILLYLSISRKHSTIIHLCFVWRVAINVTVLWLHWVIESKFSIQSQPIILSVFLNGIANFVVFFQSFTRRSFAMWTVANLTYLGTKTTISQFILDIEYAIKKESNVNIW